MDNLKRLIQLAKADGGKFFVLDENGQPELVIMSIEEYEKVLLKKVQNQLQSLEEVNAEIAAASRAELLEQEQLRSQAQSAHDDMVNEVIDPTFSFEDGLSANPAEPQELEQRAGLEDI